MPRGVVHRVERTSNTPTWTGAQLPQVAIAMTSDVRLMAGRRYRLRWRDIVEQAVLTPGHYARMFFQVSRDGGGSWTNVARAWNFGTGVGGTWNFLVDSSASYKPASDEDVRFRVSAGAVGGTSFNVFFGANDSDAVAFLEIEDQGGEF